MASTDTERYVRLMLLTFEGGTWISRQILVREIDSSDSPNISILLQNNERDTKLKYNAKEISEKQYLILNETMRDGNHLNDWNVQLLVKMNLFLFESTLSAQDKSDLKDILVVRNGLICSQPKMDELAFVASWTKLISCLSRLSSNIGEYTRQRLSQTISRLSSGPLDLPSSISRLGELCKNDEQMVNVIQTLSRKEQEQCDIAPGLAIANVKLDGTNHKQEATGEPQIMYDAFVCCNEDSEKDMTFVKELTEKLENEFNLKLYLPWRDCPPKEVCLDAMAKIIEHRCRRIIIVLSTSFIQSVNCVSITEFALSLYPGARHKKIAPILIESCEVPHVLRHIVCQDFTRKELREWFWNRLAQSLKAP